MYFDNQSINKMTMSGFLTPEMLKQYNMIKFFEAYGNKLPRFMIEHYQEALKKLEKIKRILKETL